MIRLFSILALALVLLAPQSVVAASWWQAIDGDTIKFVEPVKDSKRLHTLRTVRLWGIDAPESVKQRAKCAKEVELGLAAKAAVQSLLFEARRVRIDKRDVKEKYGRELAGVVITTKGGERVDLAAHLISKGHARAWLGHGSRPDWCS